MRSEFEFIRNIKKKYRLGRVGDDCAVLPKDAKNDLVVTADLLVEEVDFRLDWTPPKSLGFKAAAVSLSDIAAMGATPKWAMVTIGAPEAVWKSGFVDEFFDGYFQMNQKFDVEIVGGDVSRSDKGLVIDSIVGGEVPVGQAVLRSGAKAGDGIFVTGELGASGAGLQLLERGLRIGHENQEWENSLLDRHLHPSPRVLEGIRFRELGATAMIDISDGLSSDLGHLCDAGGVGAIIDANDVPVHKDVHRLALDPAAQLDFALNSGEDFELLFTIDEKKLSEEQRASLKRIGVVTERVGIIELVTDSARRELSRSGYRHF